MRRLVLALLVLAATLVALPGAASAHPERATFFPDFTRGSVPEYRAGGKTLVVCKKDSKTRINKIFKGRGKKNTGLRKRALKNLKKCQFPDIQPAVNKATNDTRILVMPGVYTEEPSRAKPIDDPACREMFETPEDGDSRVATFEHQVKCPNARNLISIVGDSLDDPDRECDSKCNLQLLGQGREPGDVTIVGDRIKKDVIRADRADGFYLRNILTEQGAFNNVDVVETNGFRLSKLETRGGQNYGILTFASDNGVYDTVEAYHNGDSGVYPGSGPEGHCKRFGIEIRDVNSHDNVLGASGTAGNGTWYHDNKFHHNGTGVVNDSFASGHPGMPQDCSKWTSNEVYSNNTNFFEDSNEKYCNSTPFAKRDPERVCPQFQSPVGTGFALYGGNANQFSGNKIYDNWRSGARLFYVPAIIRGIANPEAQSDTSNGNRYFANQVGIGPDGKAMPNGEDFTWDAQGVGNCWQDNQPAPGRKVTSNTLLPDCSNPSKVPAPQPQLYATEVPCATWHPQDNPDPPGCTWFMTPPKPE